MPTWVQLQYAIAVEKYRHFGKASQACRVTQPTLSQQIQKLEDEVGIILFDRAKKPILPTPEGQLFLEQAKTVLREQERLLNVAKQFKEGAVSGEFRLAVIPTVASDLLPIFLKPFTKAYPQVTLAIEELKTETILQELASDRLDGAILATPVAGSEGFKIHPLYYEPFYVYFSAGHELLKFSEISRSQLDMKEMWLLQDGHCFKDQVLNYCARSGAAPQPHGGIRFQSGSLDTLRRIVQTNPGYTLLPALTALALRKQEQEAHLRPFKRPFPTREVSLVYRRDHWKLAIIRAIEETISRNLPKSVSKLSENSMKVIEAS